MRRRRNTGRAVFGTRGLAIGGVMAALAAAGGTAGAAAPILKAPEASATPPATPPVQAATATAPGARGGDPQSAPPKGVIKTRPTVSGFERFSVPPVGLLTYHNGPVMHHATAYTVFWQPSGAFMSANYKTLINRLFNDLGNTTHYEIMQQYADNASIPFRDVTLGGTYTDTTAFPGGRGSSGSPLTDQDVINAVTRALSNNPTWSNDTNHEVFIFLPKDAYLGHPGFLSFTDFCAYHSAYKFGGETGYTHPYAAMPYVGTNLGACAAGGMPNGDADADGEISTTAHELMETVSDPDSDNNGNPTGWFWQDTAHEISDQCAYLYGALNTPNGGNVILHGDEYSIQLEWSNAAVGANPPTQANGCIKASAANPAQPSISTTASPSVPVIRPISDSAVLANGQGETGTLTFKAYGPNDNNCTGPVAFTAGITVNGNGTYNSGPFVPHRAGVYRWTVDYPGDVNNLNASSGCNAQNESTTVTSVSAFCASPPSPGQGITSVTQDGATYQVSNPAGETVLVTGRQVHVIGGAGPDVIFSGPGNDWLQGGGGNDIVCGGAGNDRLEGGDGDDALAGGAGNDRLLGGAGDDVLDGGDGYDFLDGEGGTNLNIDSGASNFCQNPSPCGTG